MRTAGVVLGLVALLGGGCSGPHATARNLLLGVMVVAGGAAVTGAVISNDRKTTLQKDAMSGGLTGRQFAERDAEGVRWNRIARGSTFVAGLALVGVALIWEMNTSDSISGDVPAPQALVPLPAHQTAAQSAIQSAIQRSTAAR